ncbi:MAG: hypothetical protein IPP74_12325 [Alphaproteobacteria bacterium]|nr:hypothetical protein [Alphaproteobacteria bacterium]
MLKEINSFLPKPINQEDIPILLSYFTSIKSNSALTEDEKSFIDKAILTLNS